MAQNRHRDGIIKTYHDGMINDYMRDRLLSIGDQGTSEELLAELLADAAVASSFGVRTEKDYQDYFFICNAVDDILNDTFDVSLSDDEKHDLHKHVFDSRSGNLKNLVSLRVLIHEWLCNRFSKVAHPNIGGKDNRSVIFDLEKWISTLKAIYNSVHNGGATKAQALEYFTHDFDSDERTKFTDWMKYYEERTTEKYNVKNANLLKEADLDFVIPGNWAKPEDRQNQQYMSTYKTPQKTQRELELEQAKALKMKMRSRLLSFKKLLDRYNDILPKQNVESIYSEIFNLDKSISKLDVFASVQDCIYRSANRMRKFGFSEGAELLEKTAAEPIAGNDVVKSMPAGMSNQPNLPQAGQLNVSIKTIIERLEGLSKTLKSRDMIRELASIDILLNELGLASYFPELTDAQSKLIESYGYASNKVESIIAKLRGSGVSKPKPTKVDPPKVDMPAVKQQQPVPLTPPADKIDTGEMMSKPVGEIKQELPSAPVAPKKPV